MLPAARNERSVEHDVVGIGGSEPTILTLVTELANIVLYADITLLQKHKAHALLEDISRGLAAAGLRHDVDRPPAPAQEPECPIDGTAVYERDYVVAPGETLLETLWALDMTQTELAKRTGRPVNTINQIITGKATITPEIAVQLERVLGVPACIWNNLEAHYQDARARLDAEGSKE